jgi:hypothetical protein
VGGQDSLDETARFIYRLVHNAPLVVKCQGLQVAIADLQPCGVPELNLYLNCTKRQTVKVQNLEIYFLFRWSGLEGNPQP